jgi:dTDP-4-dehydrorhamnose reductase
MKILLTGASGQLGQEWQQWAEREAKIELFPFTSSQLDITSRDQLLVKLQEVQPDIVVNCAAFTDVDGAESKQDLANQVNAEAVAYLAEMSTELGFKLVHYSTDYIFAGSKDDRKQYPDGYPEDAPADPINTYGCTKWEGEKALGDATSDYLILRLSWVCGQFGGNFVKTMLRLGQERDKLQVVNDQWGSPTFTENVVRNTLALLKAKEQGVYNITSKGMITWYDFAEAIFELSDTDVDLEPVTSDAFPTEAERPHFSKLSTKKLEAVSGSRVTDWRDGLEALLSQLQNR